MKTTILAIDQGTTNTKALLVNRDGAVLARSSVPTPVQYPKPGWVEQDPVAIWRCTVEAIASCLAAAEPRVTDIAAIGISNQRETALLWDRHTGKPVGPAVVWQCRRSAGICHDLKTGGHEPLLKATTGLQVDPMFAGTKLRWLLDHVANGHARAAAGDLCAGTVDAWLLWNLTGGGCGTSGVHATDATNASRTQLMALDGLTWDAQALDIIGIPEAALPTIQPSSHCFGETRPLPLPGGYTLPGGIPIAAMVGDSHASLYGLGGFRPGSIKATYGTGTSLMTPTASVVQSTHGLSSTVAWAIGEQRLDASSVAGPYADPNCERPAAAGKVRQRSCPVTATYALEGNIYTTGGAVAFVGELLGLADPAPEVEALARTVPSSGSVTFVPALVGLGAPYWQDSAKGTITGLTLGTGRGHLARAALEAIAFQVRDVFDVMQAEAGTPLQMLLADGGASQNDLLMQFQADILACPVERSRSSDVSALGAAYLAGLAVGIWRDQDAVANLIPPRDRFEPQMPATDRADAYAKWQRAVRRTLG